MTSTGPGDTSGQDFVQRLQHAAGESVSEFPQATVHAHLLRILLRDRVGAYFRNTYGPGTPGICNVCRAPATDWLCRDCTEHREAFDGQLADRTIQLTYALGNCPTGKHQSAHVVRAYKGESGAPPSPDCQVSMRSMIRISMELHRPCMSAGIENGWESLTFIPSRERPDATHPVAMLAKSVEPPQPPPNATPPLQRFLLAPGSGSTPKHKLVADRFYVPERWRAAVDGKNVLIVDDTWTRGASAQGAAIAAKAAGARTVTVLCVSRWLNWDWQPNTGLIASLTEDYNALLCPMTGQVCQQVAAYEIGSQGI